MMLAKFDKLSRREKAGLAAALLLFFVAAADNFAARPIVNTLRALDEQIAVAARTLAYNHGVVRMEAETAREYEQVRQRVGVAASPAEATAEFKGAIDALARQTGISILKMDHRKPVEMAAVEEFCVDIGNFEGDIKNAVRFLQETRQAPGLLRVVKLSLVPGGSKDMVKGALSVTKLMLKDPAAAAEAEAPPASSAPK